MNVVITGASRGVGFSLVKHLLKTYDCKVLAISRNREKLDILKEEVERKEKLYLLPVDLSGENLENEITPILNKHFQTIDLLINNAGYLVNKPFLELTKKDFDLSYTTNVYSIIKLLQLVHEQLKRARNAHVVNIGSMGGVLGSAKFPGLSIYSSSKGAVSILSECLAEEFKEDKIAVNCLALGAVQTEMLNEAFPGYKAPLQPFEIAEFIADFGINAHKYINGKVIPVSLSTP